MRQFFDLPQDITYLNTSYMGLQPKVATEAALQAVHQKERPWEITAKTFIEINEQLREMVARLLKAQPQEISLIPSVSYGVETVIQILRPKKKILVPEGDFPSNIYPWYQYAKKNGVDVVRVQKGLHGWTESFLKAIDDQVGLVSVPQCDWSTGELFDLQKISEKVKSVGAQWVVDASQSFGAVPIHVNEFEPDALVSVGYKWQLGPYGQSYLYVDSKHLHQEPIENNWLNRKNSEDFSALTNYQFEYQPGARRFDSGGRSHFAVPASLAALKVLAEQGLQKNAEHIFSLTSHLAEGARSLDLYIEGSSDHRHILGIRVPSQMDRKEMVQKLTAEKCFVSLRGEHLRISPHLYNNRQDIDHFLEVLKNLVKPSPLWTAMIIDSGRSLGHNGVSN